MQDLSGEALLSESAGSGGPTALVCCSLLVEFVAAHTLRTTYEDSPDGKLGCWEKHHGEET